MPIIISNGSINYEQNQYFNLETGVTFYSSKSIPGCYGKWYYEFTHKYGGTNFHLVGFATGVVGVFAYPMNSTNPYVFINGIYSPYSSKSEFIKIPFTIESDHTIGVAIDYENENFYVYYNNNYYEQKFKKPSTCNRIQAVTYGASIEMDDDISFNYGITPFKYNITGFTPWDQNISKVSCFYNCRMFLKAPLIFILLISK